MLEQAWDPRLHSMPDNPPKRPGSHIPLSSDINRTREKYVNEGRSTLSKYETGIKGSDIRAGGLGVHYNEEQLKSMEIQNLGEGKFKIGQKSQAQLADEAWKKLAAAAKGNTPPPGSGLSPQDIEEMRRRSARPHQMSEAYAQRNPEDILSREHAYNPKTVPMDSTTASISGAPSPMPGRSSKDMPIDHSAHGRATGVAKDIPERDMGFGKMSGEMRRAQEMHHAQQADKFLTSKGSTPSVGHMSPASHVDDAIDWSGLEMPHGSKMAGLAEHGEQVAKTVMNGAKGSAYAEGKTLLNTLGKLKL